MDTIERLKFEEIYKEQMLSENYNKSFSVLAYRSVASCSLHGHISRM